MLANSRGRTAKPLTFSGMGHRIVVVGQLILISLQQIHKPLNPPDPIIATTTANADFGG
jgi:hypothetical protein